MGAHLWMGTGLGVINYDTNSSESYEVYDNQNHLLSNGIFAINFDSHNLPWIGTYGGGLSYFEGSLWNHFNTPQGLNDAFVYDIEFDKKSLWIATWSGVNKVTGNPKSRKNIFQSDSTRFYITLMVTVVCSEIGERYPPSKPTVC